MSATTSICSSGEQGDDAQPRAQRARVRADAGGRWPGDRPESGDHRLSRRDAIPIRRWCRATRWRARMTLQRALVIAADIHPVDNLRILQRLGAMGIDQAARDDWYRHWIAEGFAALEAMAGDGAFLGGDAPDLSDVCLVPQMYNARRLDNAARRLSAVGGDRCPADRDRRGRRGAPRPVQARRLSSVTQLARSLFDACVTACECASADPGQSAQSANVSPDSFGPAL